MFQRIRNANSTVLLAFALSSGCTPAQSADERVDILDYESMLRDLSRLSHDSMGGRATGSPHGEMARRYIAREFAAAGLRPFGASFEQSFLVSLSDESVTAVNLVGFVSGRGDPDRMIVISAHYDHLGIRNDSIFNGADDNASGTAALLALARYVAVNPLQHTAIFFAADAEELGLKGAHAFMGNPPVPRETIALNVNLDMISHSDSILFAAGSYHYPWLQEPLQRVAARATVSLQFGHDRPDLPAGDDWTNASDHGPFHDAGIPFVYFGVEDHPDYHSPSDDFDTINPDFYRRAVETVRDAVYELDRSLDANRVH